MPFIGKDWRAPGETWVRVSHTSGWERSKLRPIQLVPCTGSSSSFDSIASGSPLALLIENAGTEAVPLPALPLSSSLPVAAATNCRVKSFDSDAGGADEKAALPRACARLPRDSSGIIFHRNNSSASISSTDELNMSLSSSYSSSCTFSLMNGGTTLKATRSDSEDFGSGAEEDESASGSTEPWIPHCFVKTTRSKEFIGCTSMSEAFHLLDLARAVTDVRRFNYICKKNGRIVACTAAAYMYMRSVEQDVHVTTARELLNGFSNGLEEGHVCGSPQLVSRQLDTVSGLIDMFAERKPTTLCDSSEDSLTFLDLPREVLSKIVCCLPDHVSILEMAKAHEALEALIEREARVWRSLCQFHFTQQQIGKHRTSEDMTWRRLFFELKKYYGLREVYADLIHICCHCKALFWKDHGHPCVAKDAAAPSVRVTPRQFVDMLLFL